MGVAALGDRAMDGSVQGPHTRGCRDRRLYGEQGRTGARGAPGTDLQHDKGGSRQGTWARLAGGARQGSLGGVWGGGGEGGGGLGVG